MTDENNTDTAAAAATADTPPESTAGPNEAATGGEEVAAHKDPAPEVNTGKIETGKSEADNTGTSGPAIKETKTSGGEDAGDKPARPAAGEGAKDKNPEATAGEVQLAFPEGVEVDKAVLGEFKGLIGELGLDSGQAQRFVDLQTRMMTAQRDAFADTLKGWSDAAAADREIGGPAFAENVAAARTALDKFGTPELRDALTATGMGNHPELVRAFVRIGKAMGDGQFVSGGRETVRRGAADVFYDADDGA
jgi:hypothetical protein